MRGFRASSTRAGSQECSYSRPIRMSRSARFSFGMKLGLIGIPCGSSTPRARLSTVAASPAIRPAISARSGSVVMIVIFSAAHPDGTHVSSDPIIQKLASIRFMWSPLSVTLKEPVPMASQEHGPLEEKLVHIVGVPSVNPVVLETHALELAGHPGQVRAPCPVVGPVTGRVARRAEQSGAGICHHQRLGLELEIIKPDARPPLLAQTILGIGVAAPRALATRSAQAIPPAPAVHRVRFADVI